MLWDWGVLVCAELNSQNVGMAEEVMVMCHWAGWCNFKENGTDQEGMQAKLLFWKARRYLLPCPTLTYVYLHLDAVNLLQIGVCCFSSLLWAESRVMFVCRCLWCVQLALAHLSSVWCALEYPAQPAVPWETCQGDRGWMGLVLICSTRALPPACTPCSAQATLLMCISLPADRTEPWDGMWPCLSGLLKLRGRLYFVVWIGKWHGHPQLQRSCFALVEEK